MNREQYIIWRSSRNINILYEWYKEAWKPEIGEFLDPRSFSQHIMEWPGISSAYEYVTSVYDAKFNIIRVMDLKSGEIIKFV